MNTITEQTTEAYALGKDHGVTDLWWPYGAATGRYTIKVSGAETDGRLLTLLVRDRRGAGTPLHRHRDSDETFYVIAGTLTLFVGDERLDLAAGDFAFAPMGVPHAFTVTSEEAEFLVSCSSAGTEGPLGHGIGGFFQEVAGPVVAGEDPPEPRMPDPAEFGRLMDVYGIDLLGPPPSL